MKHSLLTAAACITIAACTSQPTPQQQAEQIIRQYCQENAHDPKSYQPVRFSSLDSTFTSFYTSERYQQLNERLNRYSERFSACMEADNLDSAQIYHQYSTALRDTITAEAETYKGQHNGWKTVHTFRAANRLGALNLDSATFYLNIELTEITQMK